MPATCTSPRGLTINSRSVNPVSERTVLGITVRMGEVLTDYVVSLGRYTAIWQKEDTAYVVTLGPAPTGERIACGCTCPDRRYRATRCKHMAATETVLTKVS